MLMRLALVSMVIVTVFGRAPSPKDLKQNKRLDTLGNLNARNPLPHFGRRDQLELTPTTPPPPPPKDLNVVTLPLVTTPSTSTTQNSKSNEDTKSNQIPTKKPAQGGIGPPPSSTENLLSIFQAPDSAQFGIGTPPEGFRAPTKKKGKSENNSDLNSAPF